MGHSGQPSSRLRNVVPSNGGGSELGGYGNILVFEDDALFIDTTLDIVRDAMADLPGHDWDLMYLGGCVHEQRFPFVDGSAALQVAKNVTCTPRSPSTTPI